MSVDRRRSLELLRQSREKMMKHAQMTQQLQEQQEEERRRRIEHLLDARRERVADLMPWRRSPQRGSDTSSTALLRKQRSVPRIAGPLPPARLPRLPSAPLTQEETVVARVMEQQTLPLTENDIADADNNLTGMLPPPRLPGDDVDLTSITATRSGADDVSMASAATRASPRHRHHHVQRSAARSTASSSHRSVASHRKRNGMQRQPQQLHRQQRQYQPSSLLSSMTLYEDSWFADGAAGSPHVGRQSGPRTLMEARVRDDSRSSAAEVAAVAALPDLPGGDSDSDDDDDARDRPLQRMSLDRRMHLGKRDEQEDRRQQMQPVQHYHEGSENPHHMQFAERHRGGSEDETGMQLLKQRQGQLWQPQQRQQQQQQHDVVEQQQHGVVVQQDDDDVVQASWSEPVQRPPSRRRGESPRRQRNETQQIQPKQQEQQQQQRADDVIVDVPRAVPRVAAAPTAIATTRREMWQAHLLADEERTLEASIDALDKQLLERMHHQRGVGPRRLPPMDARSVGSAPDAPRRVSPDTASVIVPSGRRTRRPSLSGMRLPPMPHPPSHAAPAADTPMRPPPRRAAAPSPSRIPVLRGGHQRRVPAPPSAAVASPGRAAPAAMRPRAPTTGRSRVAMPVRGVHTQQQQQDATATKETVVWSSDTAQRMLLGS